MVAGGTEIFPAQPGTGPGIHHNHLPGLRNTWIFDPTITTTTTNPWTEVALMNYEPPIQRVTGGGRWYPTLI